MEQREWTADHVEAREAYLRIADQQAYHEMRQTLLYGPWSITERAHRAVRKLTEHVQRTMPVRCVDHEAPELDAAWGTYTALYDQLVVGGIDTAEPDEPLEPDVDRCETDDCDRAARIEPRAGVLTRCCVNCGVLDNHTKRCNRKTQATEDAEPAEVMAP